MRIDVTLRNERAEQFQRVKEDMEETLGHEVTRTQVLGYLMAEYEIDDEGRVLP